MSAQEKSATNLFQSTKLHMVRQDRTEYDPDRHSIRLADGKVGKVLNYTPFGLAVETEFKPEPSYNECLFFVDDYPISNLALNLVRRSENVFGRHVTAYSVTGDPLDVEAAHAIKDLNVMLTNTLSKVKEESKLPERFRLKVLEIKDVLYKTQTEINSLSRSTFEVDLAMNSHYEDCISKRVSNFLSVSLTPIYDELKESVSGLTFPQLNFAFDFFRKNVGEIMYQSAYAHRAYSKPKGYAGDFEMMNHVYRRELRGDSLFAKCLQRYFVDEPAGRAVRNREVYIRGKILECIQSYQSTERKKILSVASGPAMEVQNLVSDPQVNLKNVEIHLLDQDLDALKHAQRRIMELARVHGKSVSLHLHNLSIKKVISEGLPESSFNLIYSAGLFDYFTDPVAKFAASVLHRSLAKEGRLIIGNFSLHNPNQFSMGLIMDWNLIYRSEEKMKELFGSIGSEYELEKEPEGINIFANLKK